MSDYYTTSEEEFDPNDDFISGEEKVDSPNSVVNRENITTIVLPPQEVLSDGLSVNHSKNKTSPVWNFMSEQMEGDKVIARICGKCEQKFSPTTTTGVLGNHLSNKHGIELVLKRNSLIQRPYGKGDVRCKKECFDAVLNLVVCCQLPFAIIENSWFQQMVTIFDPRYKLPSRQYIKKEIMHWFKTRYELVAKELGSLTKVVDNMVELLEPMLVATELLSSSSYPAISNICLTFLELLLHLNKFLDNESYLTEQYMMADSIKSKLNEYWSMLEESTTIATILDPSFKLRTFSASDKDAALASLRSTMTHYKSQVPATTTTSTSTSISKLPSKNKKKFFESLLTQQQTIEQPLMEELEHYLIKNIHTSVKSLITSKVTLKDPKRKF
ncbi:11996_t:CDS:2 [Dentiscutata heterogama]|uniref:11996_t:CDS:1 n=1 Tax=Dentiscutata heterogama TaxID=1316150 RepID=A0ACA9MFP8_9GLOM|nr:11996_t:CDS:2 [Dentiscutata heterogama]